MDAKIKKKIQEAVLLSPHSMAEAARIASMRYNTFIYRAKKLGVYTPNQSGKGRKLPSRGVAKLIPLSEIVYEGKHPQYSTYMLKNRLIEGGIKKEECEVCGIGPMWNGKHLTLQLDHRDGNPRNHLLSNLRVICPNCHTQTETWGKKKRPGGGIRQTHQLEGLALETACGFESRPGHHHFITKS